MAYGICYTRSSSVKKYEANQLGEIPSYVTVYTVGYPSTAYYTNCAYIDFDLTEYSPTYYGKYEGFVEGTARYYTSASIGEDALNAIYDLLLMSYTPPEGYILDDHGKYSYEVNAYSYYCNYDIKYGNVINTINTEPDECPLSFNYRLEYKYLMFGVVSMKPFILNNYEIDNMVDENTYGKDLYRIDLSKSDKFIIDETVVLDSNYADNYKSNAINFIFYDGTIDNTGYQITNRSVYIVTNTGRYQVGESSLHFKLFSGSSSNEVGFIRSDYGLYYEITCNKIGDNFLLPDNIKNINGGYIPNFSVKCIHSEFTLVNNDYSRNCESNIYFENKYN